MPSTRDIRRRIKSVKNTAQITKAMQMVASSKMRKPQLAAEFTYKDAPLFSEARAISRFAREMFLKGEVDHVDVLFTKFISTLNQKPEARQLLPVGEIKAPSAGEPAPAPNKEAPQI